MKCRDCPHLDIPDAEKRQGCCVDDMPGHRALMERMAAQNQREAPPPRIRKSR